MSGPVVWVESGVTTPVQWRVLGRVLQRPHHELVLVVIPCGRFAPPWTSGHGHMRHGFAQARAHNSYQGPAFTLLQLYATWAVTQS